MFNYWIYLFICARIFGLMLINPLFNAKLTPNFIRGAICFSLAIIFFPMFNMTITPDSLFIKIAFLLLNVADGVVLGYLTSLPLFLIEAVGNLIDQQRGEQFGAMINNLTNTPSSSLSKLMSQGFYAYFILSGGLLFLIKIVGISFIAISPVEIFPHQLNFEFVIREFCRFCYYIIILSLPIMFSMFIAEFSLGLFSTFVKQLEVTTLAMPIKSVVAMIILSLYLSSLYHIVIEKFVNNEIIYVFK